MLYFCGLLYIILKGLVFVIHNEILFHLNRNNLIFLFILILIIFMLKKALQYKKIYADMTDHIMQYRFITKKGYYYTVTILSTIIISYITTIIFLRLRAFNKPVDLNVISSALEKLLAKMSKGMLCYNAFILLLMIYVFLLIIKLIKKRLNIHVIKMHFYLMSFKKYIDIHNNFRDYISINSRVIRPIATLFTDIQDSILSIIVFGYFKNTNFLFSTDAQLKFAPKTKKYLWTEQEKALYITFAEKYRYSDLTLGKPFKYFFYHLHIIILMLIIIYDILYNNRVLTHVAFILPFLFFYQIYILLSQFVQDKIVYDISEVINTLYYKNVEHINHKLWMIDGEIYEKPNNEEIVTDFLKYEAAEFYYTRIST